MKEFFDKLIKQPDKNSCGFYAYSRAIRAKALMQKYITRDDGIDPEMIRRIAKVHPKNPMNDPKFLVGKIFYSAKGVPLYVRNLMKRISYDIINNEVQVAKTCINNNAPLLTAITYRGQSQVDGFTEYHNDLTMPKDLESSHWVVIYDYDDKYFYLADSGEGKVTRIPISLAQDIIRNAYIFDIEIATVKFNYPIKDPIVTQGFGARPEYYKQFGGQWVKGHVAIDIRTKNPQHPDGVGTPILSSHKGIIRNCKSPTYGNYVEVEDFYNKDFMTRYCHLSKTLLNDGMIVPIGGQLGLSGSTGNSEVAHLHWELLYKKTYINPLDYVGVLEMTLPKI